VSVLVLTLLTLPFSVSALGIGPVYSNIDFEPELEYRGSFNIYEEGNYTGALTIEGELADFIELDFQEVNLIDKERIYFTLRLPKRMEPGDYKSKIIVPGSTISEGVIGAVPSVSHKITLKVPVHGKYISVDINLEGDSENSITETIKNIGFETIETLEVFNVMSDVKNDRVHKEVKKKFSPEETFITSISKNLPLGRYYLSTSIKYDQFSKNYTNEVIIGKKQLHLKKLLFKDFKLGKINQIDAFVESNWNEELIGVHLEIDVFSNRGLETRLKSINFNIEDEKIIDSFWNTEGLNEGIHTFHVRAFQNEELLMEEEHKVLVKEEKAKVQKMNISTGKLFLYLTTALYMLILITIILLYMRKKQEKKKKNKEKKDAE